MRLKPKIFMIVASIIAVTIYLWKPTLFPSLPVSETTKWRNILKAFYIDTEVDAGHDMPLDKAEMTKLLPPDLGLALQNPQLRYYYVNKRKRTARDIIMISPQIHFVSRNEVGEEYGYMILYGDGQIALIAVNAGLFKEYK